MSRHRGKTTLMFILAAGWWIFTSFTGSASEGIENNEKYALLHCNELQCLHMKCRNEDNTSWISRHNVFWSHTDTQSASSWRFECLRAKHWNNACETDWESGWGKCIRGRTTQSCDVPVQSVLLFQQVSVQTLTANESVIYERCSWFWHPSVMRWSWSDCFH